jgi:acyl carrier protein
MITSDVRLEAGLRELLTEILPPLGGEVQLGLNDSLRDAGLDSLRTLELISSIELHFRVQLGEEDLRDEYFSTLSGLIGMLRLRRAE